MPTFGPFNLPASVPKVTLHAKYLAPDGRPHGGWVEILAPLGLTFPNADTFVTGPIVLPLDSEGGFTVVLPATDVAGQNPTEWAYQITERLTGVNDRAPYMIALPQSLVDPFLDELAPTDPTTPTYVPVEGGQIYTGTADPMAGLGKHGDMYVKRDISAAFLGVTDTSVTFWQNVNDVWQVRTGEVRGHKIYVNNTTTSSATTREGDLLIRSDTGDFWQRGASSWGTVKGNLKGPKGDKGDKGDTGATGAASTVPGPTGPKGDTGVRGSRVYEGPIGEVAGLLDGDWSINAGSGAVYMREGGQWVTKGNIRGPQGLTGATGPQGPKGDPGTGSGTVTAVNTVLPDGGGNVTLTAANVGAMPTTGGQFTGDITLNGAAGAYRQFSLDVAGLKRWTFQKDDVAEPGDGTGSNLRISSRNDDGTFKSTVFNADRGTGQVTIGSTTALGDGKFTVAGAAGLKDVTPQPATPTGGSVLYSEAGVLKVATPTARYSLVQPVPLSTRNVANGVAPLDSGAKVPIANLPAGTASGVATLDASTKIPVAQIPTSVQGSKNEWGPEALGFKAWSHDPNHVSNPTTLKAAVIQRLYLCAVNITESTVVNDVYIHSRGWAGNTAVPAARFFGGIYNSSGSRVAWTGSTALSNVAEPGQTTGTPAGQKNNHIGPVELPLTAAYTMAPGKYWLAFLMSAGAATDFYYFHVQNEAPANAGGSFFLGTPFIRNMYFAGQTTLPATITPANGLMDHDPCIMAVA
ncbi:hypothetical protein CPT_Shady_019 [Streptomyces phage Shady]|uniref:Minor tail protein n=1 Tax=Streptomyces phage Shady TaxID=2767585 RepID=A0A873WED9_9CAUD|nr:hypothetical protein CPT_Shady_019 [Streptomyces phage Shady]